MVKCEHRMRWAGVLTADAGCSGGLVAAAHKQLESRGLRQAQLTPEREPICLRVRIAVFVDLNLHFTSDRG